MTATGDGDGREAVPVDTDEQFLHTVVTKNVVEADAALWSFFERFLGGDVVEAWQLAEVTHRPQQVMEVDQMTGEPKPTGEWELVSSGTWKRDANVPTPVVPLKLVSDDELEAIEI